MKAPQSNASLDVVTHAATISSYVILPVIATVPSSMFSVGCSVMLKLEGPSLMCSEVFLVMLTSELLSLKCPVVSALSVKLISEVVTSVDSLVLAVIKLELPSVWNFGLKIVVSQTFWHWKVLFSFIVLNR